MLERLGWNALAFAPFRTFFLANFAGNSSWFVFNAGFGWLVLTLTATPEQPQGSAAIVGLAYFINGLPFLLLTLHAGLLTDRFGARPLVAISFALTGMVMIAMGALALTTAVPLWLIIGLAFISGATMTLGAPGYVSIVNDLVPPGVVSSGVALNFLGISVGRIVGGFIGGILVATVPGGMGACRCRPAAGGAVDPCLAAAHSEQTAARNGGQPVAVQATHRRHGLRPALPDARGDPRHVGGARRSRALLQLPAACRRARPRHRRRRPGPAAGNGRRRRAHRGSDRRAGHAFAGPRAGDAAGARDFLDRDADLRAVADHRAVGAAMPLVGGGFILYSAATLTLIQALASRGSSSA